MILVPVTPLATTNSPLQSEALNSAKYNQLHTTLHEVPAPVHYELSGEGVQPPVEMNAPDVEAPPYTEKAREDFGL